MKHHNAKPCPALASHIHSFWELKGDDNDNQWERIFPDGCAGIVVNLGASCKTDSGLTTMEHGKTYVVGAMTTFKDSFMNMDTHLVGVCLKPAVFSSFYKYVSQHELTDHTVEFDSSYSFDIGKVHKDPYAYFNRYFLDRRNNVNSLLQTVLKDIHVTKGDIRICDIAKRNYTTVRQLERMFKTHIGLTPKEYVKIVRFQSVLSLMDDPKVSLSDIAFEGGYYDQSHLTNEMKRYTGLTPARF
ncbi:DUF6597 domain-containing transcriptional factor [Chitinophaga sp. 22536]|uniref:DUF6597 domain-containing transcriptional factor n=1 Tax=unclassified Chitinophaga TaxID=2619133 RepID=UPI003F83A0AF